MYRTFREAADLDGGNDVDQADFAVFQLCFSGDGNALSDAATSSEGAERIEIVRQEIDLVPRLARDVHARPHLAAEESVDEEGLPGGSTRND